MERAWARWEILIIKYSWPLKPQRKRSLWRIGFQCEDNIKINLKYAGCCVWNILNCIRQCPVAGYCEYGNETLGSNKAEIFLTMWVTISFSIKTLLHGDNYMDSTTLVYSEGKNGFFWKIRYRRFSLNAPSLFAFSDICGFISVSWRASIS
jgi:hypothetical protein